MIGKPTMRIKGGQNVYENQIFFKKLLTLSLNMYIIRLYVKAVCAFYEQSNYHNYFCLIL